MRTSSALVVHCCTHWPIRGMALRETPIYSSRTLELHVKPSDGVSPPQLVCCHRSSLFYPCHPTACQQGQEPVVCSSSFPIPAWRQYAASLKDGRTSLAKSHDSSEASADLSRDCITSYGSGLETASWIFTFQSLTSAPSQK